MALSIGGLPIVVGSILKLINLNLGLAIAIEVLCIIIGVWLSNGKNE